MPQPTADTTDTADTAETTEPEEPCGHNRNHPAATPPPTPSSKKEQPTSTKTHDDISIQCKSQPQDGGAKISHLDGVDVTTANGKGIAEEQQPLSVATETNNPADVVPVPAEASGGDVNNEADQDDWEHEEDFSEYWGWWDGLYDFLWLDHDDEDLLEFESDWSENDDDCDDDIDDDFFE